MGIPQNTRQIIYGMRNEAAKKKIKKKIKKEKAASVDLIQFLPLIVYFNSVFVLSLLVFGTTFHLTCDQAFLYFLSGRQKQKGRLIAGYVSLVLSW